MADIKIECAVTVTNNVIELVPVIPLENNYKYTIAMNNIKSADGLYDSGAITKELYSEFTPMYCTVESVQMLLQDKEIDEIIIKMNIREASKFVDFIRKNRTPAMLRAIEYDVIHVKEDISYEADQYARYRAAYDCLVGTTISRTSQSGLKGQLGDVIFDISSDTPDISDLLDLLKDQFEYWLDVINGVVKGTAMPTSAVKSSNRLLNTSLPHTCREQVFNPSPHRDGYGHDYGHGYNHGCRW
jgi:hypothetical protein